MWSQREGEGKRAERDAYKLAEKVKGEGEWSEERAGEKEGDDGDGGGGIRGGGDGARTDSGRAEDAGGCRPRRRLVVVGGRFPAAAAAVGVHRQGISAAAGVGGAAQGLRTGGRLRLLG